MTALERYLKDNSLIQEFKLETLKGTRCGINARHAISQNMDLWNRLPEMERWHILVFPLDMTEQEQDVWKELLDEDVEMLCSLDPNPQLLYMVESKKEYCNVLYTNLDALLYTKGGKIVMEMTDSHCYAVDKSTILERLGKSCRHKITDAHFVTIYLLSHRMESTKLPAKFSSIAEAASWFYSVGGTLDNVVSNMFWSNTSNVSNAVTYLLSLIQSHLVVYFHPVLTDQGRTECISSQQDRMKVFNQTSMILTKLSEWAHNLGYNTSQTPLSLIQVLFPHVPEDIRFLTCMGVLNPKWSRAWGRGWIEEDDDSWTTQLIAQCLASLIWEPMISYKLYPSETLIPVLAHTKKWNVAQVKSETPRMSMGATAEWVRHERDRQGIPAAASSGQAKGRRSSYVSANGREIPSSGMSLKFVMEAGYYRAVQRLGGGDHVIAQTHTGEVPMNLRGLHRPEDVLPLVLLRVLEHLGYLRRIDDMPTQWAHSFQKACTSLTVLNQEEVLVWLEMIRGGFIVVDNDEQGWRRLFHLAMFILFGKKLLKKDDEELDRMIEKAKKVRHGLRGLSECVLAGFFVNEGLGKQRGVVEVVNLGLRMLPWKRQVSKNVEFELEVKQDSPETLKADSISEIPIRERCRLFWTQVFEASRGTVVNDVMVHANDWVVEWFER